jgi:hypothetical protein
MVAERIIAAGPDYLQDHFIRIMQGSAALRYEPEFADLYLEPRQTLEAAARHFPRFRRRVRRVSRQGAEAAAAAYDDYRIAVLNDLDTPQLRQQLQRRLERCIDRLKHGHDVDKIEMVLFLSVLLSDRASKLVKGKDALPLGVYGLVTAAYEDSFDRAMGEMPSARDIVGDELYELWCVRHREEDLATIAAATEQVSTFAELADRLETDPALALAWKRQELHLIEDLQAQMAAGVRLRPDFFTPDEAVLAMDKMEQRYLSKPWSLSRYFTLLALLNFTDCIRETLDEIVSPQRIAEMIEGLKSVGQQCLETDDERLHSLVPHVQAAIHHLQSEETPSQNQVVMTMYLLSLSVAASDVDALSPHWRRLFKRMEEAASCGK